MVKAKPQQFQTFLTNACLNWIWQWRITQFDTKSVKWTVSSVICDTPERISIRQVKWPMGYFSCDCYIQRGFYYDKRITFPYVKCKSRSDSSFHLQRHPKHRIGVGPFVSLPIYMTSTFPLDYAHLASLGVLNKLLQLWLQSPIKNRHHLRRSDLEPLVGELLVAAIAHSLIFNSWIAMLMTQTAGRLRNFQFYCIVWPECLKGSLPNNEYKYLMILPMSIHVPHHPYVHKTCNTFAVLCAKVFPALWSI